MTHSIQNQILSFGYNKDTFIAALVASAAAMLTATFGIAPWVMFIGWVAFFTNPTTFSNASKSAFCVSLGIILGAVAYTSIGLLAAHIGVAALAIVVFIVATFVVTLRIVPMINNIVAWFLGLIAFFAMHTEASLSAILSLIVTVNLGVLAGYSALKLQQKSNK
jgi:hypothetical protein